jgi:hypothetical protein
MLSPGDPLGQFYMDTLSGLITTTAVSLDRENEDEYRLKVSVTDGFRMVMLHIPQITQLQLRANRALYQYLCLSL